jgi:hypothetical protein
MARYLSSFFLTIMAFMWIILLGLVMERYLPGLGGQILERLSLESLLILTLIITLIICIYLPFVYKFGFGAVISGGVAVTGIVLGGFWICASFLISSNSGFLGIQAGEGNIALNALRSNSLFYYLGEIINHYGRGMTLSLIFLVIAAAIAISISISIKIFSRKEL